MPHAAPTRQLLQNFNKLPPKLRRKIFILFILSSPLRCKAKGLYSVGRPRRSLNVSSVVLSYVGMLLQLLMALGRETLPSEYLPLSGISAHLMIDLLKIICRRNELFLMVPTITESRNEYKKASKARKHDNRRRPYLVGVAPPQGRTWGKHQFQIL